MPKVRVTVDRRRVPRGTKVTFTLSPASVLTDYAVTLYFGDRQQQVMTGPQATHVYEDVGTYTYSVDVKPRQRCQPSVTLSASASSVPEGEAVRFSAQLSGNCPNIQYRFVFGDGSSSNWQSSPQAEHRYARAGNYFAYVDISDGRNRIGGSPRKRVDVRHAASLTVALTASPSTSRAGEAVTFIASAPSARSNARYRFNFGDGTQTLWQADPRAQHAFQSLGSYRAQVQVSQFINNQTLSATSSPAILTVAAGPVGQPSPRPSPAPTGQSMADSSPTPAPDGSPIGNGSPTPAGTPSPVTQENTNQSADWFSGNTWWYLLIAAVILFLIYQASGLLFATQPTFTPFADQGVAAVAHDKGALPIDFELVLDPNVSGGDYSVTTDQPRLVMSAPEPEDRQIIEI